MIEVIFDANYQGLPRKVKVSQVAGAGLALSFHLFVDNYFWAKILKENDAWRILEHSDGLLSDEEKKDIIVRIEEEISGDDLDIRYYSGLQEL